MFSFFSYFYPETKNIQNTKNNRNAIIEKRIQKRDDFRRKTNYRCNPYSGMAMDGISDSKRREIDEELAYFKQHPELYPQHPELIDFVPDNELSCRKGNENKRKNVGNK